MDWCVTMEGLSTPSGTTVSVRLRRMWITVSVKFCSVLHRHSPFWLDVLLRVYSCRRVSSPHFSFLPKLWAFNHYPPPTSCWILTSMIMDSWVFRVPWIHSHICPKSQFGGFQCSCECHIIVAWAFKTRLNDRGDSALCADAVTLDEVGITSHTPHRAVLF